MKPILVAGLPSYGIAVGLGFAVGLWLTARQARRLGMDRAAVLDLAFFILVSGLAGSRALFVALRAGEYFDFCRGAELVTPRALFRVLADCAAPLRLWEGGLVFYGGALAAAAVAAWFARKEGWAFGRVADLFAPGLALGHAIGRLGCFGAGCCYGKVCAASADALCVSFPAGSAAHEELLRHGLLAAGASTTPPLHPTQLYEAAGELVVFFALLLGRRWQRFHGALGLGYALAYALLRAAVEVFRGDPGRRFLAELSTPRLAAALGLPAGEPLFLSTSQALSLAVAVGACLVLVRRSRARSAPAHSTR